MHFRILPVVMIVFLSLVVVKAYQHRDTDTLVQEDSWGNSEIARELALEDDEADFVFAEVELEAEPEDEEVDVLLGDLEPAAGKKETSGHAEVDNPDEYKGMSVEEIKEYKRKKRLEDFQNRDLPSHASREKPEENIPQFTDAQLELLKKLSMRREELDNWENELELKANLLEVSSKKLDEKLSNLQELKDTTEKLIAEYQKEEESKLKSLVKIYENMKPKDAAKVLNELELDILLEIVGQMSEKKAALVLAKMNPERARTITEDLAKQRRLAQDAGISKRTEVR